MYSWMASAASRRVGQLRRCTSSRFKVPKKLSTTALSQQLPRPLKLHSMPWARSAPVVVPRVLGAAIGVLKQPWFGHPEEIREDEQLEMIPSSLASHARRLARLKVKGAAEMGRQLRSVLKKLAREQPGRSFTSVRGHR